MYHDDMMPLGFDHVSHDCLQSSLPRAPYRKGTGGVYADCRLVVLDSVTAVVSPILGGAKNPAGESFP